MIKTIWKLKKFSPQKGMVTFGHIDSSALVNQGLLSSTFHNYPAKCHVCRNPFSRAVSLHKYLQKIERVNAETRLLKSRQDLTKLLPSVLTTRKVCPFASRNLGG